MDKSYVVTDLEWFAEFLAVLMSSSAKGADHHTKYLHPDTPTLPVDGVTDKLKALFSSESEVWICSLKCFFHNAEIFLLFQDFLLFSDFS